MALSTIANGDNLDQDGIIWSHKFGSTASLLVRIRSFSAGIFE
jgi:hypothetical protein